MKRLAVLLLALLAVTLTAGAQETLAIYVELQVIASDPEATSITLADWADENGGYFTSRSETAVILRLPPDQVPLLRALIEEGGDTIASYNPSATDYREELARLRAAVDSRAEALDRILAFMDEADVRATLAFERELRSLLQEIEYYTGQERRINNEIAFASATVYLSSLARTIPEQRPSSFGWINTVDLYRFLQEAQP
jgi:hypothetical protein